MIYSNELIEKAAVLHDIGKIVYRAGRGIGTHSRQGAEWLRPYVPDSSEGNAIVRAVGHHHYKDLQSLSPAKDDLSYIIYEADNLAAGTDRRDIQEGDTGRFCITTPLDNVFNVFGDGKGTQTAFRLRGLMKEKRMLYPENRKNISASPEMYECVLEDIENNFRQKSPVDMTVQELMRILEATMTYAPSSTATDQAADISLYDHSKITAAYAVCMYGWFESKGVTDYREACLGRGQKDMRCKNVYMLVSGDISGIQDFIYTIPSRGALKSLRGRSFYLDFLLEHLADEILAAAGVSRNCLLYTGGGHFYMLLPNTEEVVHMLERFSKRINDWFMRMLGNRLYLAMAWTPCAACEFMDKGSGTADVFRRVSHLVSERKLCRYTPDQLQCLFSPESNVNRVAEGTRECAVCHQSVPEADLAAYGDGEENACSFCRNLLHLGQGMLNDEVIVISAEGGSDAVPLPGWDELTYYMHTVREEYVQDLTIPIRRLYIKNKTYTGAALATHVWAGDYTARDEENCVLDFSDLAAYSGGTKEEKGIRRLGVLRADVDNLGAAFLSGFGKIYDTLSRKAALSRQLSLFFKRYMNALCAGEINGDGEESGKKFSLFGTVKQEKRLVHIVYAGGDDMFLVGAWDDLIELAVDIRRKFRQFTNDKLTFSAGIGFFNPSCPISEMAREAGRLEDIAKAQPGKDSIMLFGTDKAYGRKHGGEDVYSWDRFIDRVCGEKLQFWKTHFQEPGGSNKSLIPIGKTAMYRILELLRKGCEENQIRLAQFAYVLARMEPGTHEPAERKQCYEAVRQQFYDWYKDKESRRELVTALQLIIYALREGE